MAKECDDDYEDGQIENGEMEDEIQSLLSSNEATSSSDCLSRKVTMPSGRFILIWLATTIVSLSLGGLFGSVSGGQSDLGQGPGASEAESPKVDEMINANSSFPVTQPPTSTPTSLPTLSPTLVPTVHVPEQNDPIFLPHLPFGNDRHYRRVCARVHSSILCLTLRFPFEALIQDKHYDYPRPLDKRFYGFNKSTANFIDGEDLVNCKNETQSLSREEAVKHCLDSYAASLEKPDESLVSIWTRRRLDSREADLYGVFMTPEQGSRIDKFFDNHLILAIGASPTPGIVKCLSTLFDKCRNDRRGDATDVLCGKHQKHRRILDSKVKYADLPLDQVFLGTHRYYPAGGRRHDHRMVNITQRLHSREIDIARDLGFKKLRKLTLIYEYPLAHTQNQNEILEDYETIEYIQRKFPEVLMEANLPTGRKRLQEMGYDLQHIIAFDGRPQFFPTQTGAYDYRFVAAGNSESFFEKGGYPGWIPEYGSACVGPLPPTSNLTGINKISRQAFENNGHDMNFYGRTWEFNNQFWYQMSGWAKGLDCTHSSGEGQECMHRYFVMAMVDDYFDNLK